MKVFQKELLFAQRYLLLAFDLGYNRAVFELPIPANKRGKTLPGSVKVKTRQVSDFLLSLSETGMTGQVAYW